MKSRKKLVAVILVGIILMLFTGCQSTNESTSAKAEDGSITAKPNSNDTPSWKVIKTLNVAQSANYIGFLNEEYGISVGYAGEVHYTTDGGSTWPVSENKSNCCFGLDIIDDKIAWLCANVANVRFTTDGAKTWNPVADFGGVDPNHCRYVSFLDDKTGWIATSDITLESNLFACTNDGGKTWIDMNTPSGASNIATIKLQKPGVGYMLDSNGILYFTIDNGNTWNSYDIGLNKTDILDSKINALCYSQQAVINFSDENNGLILINSKTTEGQYAIFDFRTIDGGTTWTHEKIDVNRLKIGIFLSHDGKYLTVTEGGDSKETLLMENTAR